MSSRSPATSDRLNLDGAARDAAIADARRRLALQMPDAEKAARADFVLENTGDIASLEASVAEIWQRFKAESNQRAASGSLK